MANYRTTVILKTDIVDSTPRLAGLTQSEMGLERKQHKQLIERLAIQYHGSIFQDEGDAYWIEFPSVTDAVLAATGMHQNLRYTQAGKGDKQRLAIRAVVTVGDVLHQEKDMIGTVMSLTARIEKVTPPDEIYLSHAAWLALNKAEVQTSYVNEFQLKGFNEPEKIYRVDQKHGIRFLTNQYIILADADGFTNFFKTKGIEATEKFLIEYDVLMNTACKKYGGEIRQINGDLYFMTFTDAKQTLNAMILIHSGWKDISKRLNIGLTVGVHKGDILAFRSYVFSEDLNTTMFLANFGKQSKSGVGDIFIVTSIRIRDEFMGTEHERMFKTLDISRVEQDSGKAVLLEYGACQLTVE